LRKTILHTFLSLIAVLICCACPARAVEFSGGQWRVTAIAVRDPRLPMQSRGQMLQSLDTAAGFIRDRFGADVTFELSPGETDIGDFFNTIRRQSDPEWYKQVMGWESLPVTGLDEQNFDRAALADFLKKKLPVCGGFHRDDCVPSLELFLRFYPPDARAPISNADNMAAEIIRRFIAGRNELAQLGTTGGGKYFGSGPAPYNRLNVWTGLILNRVRNADLVITNTPIVWDKPMPEVPHVVLGGGAIHGVSLMDMMRPGKISYPGTVVSTYLTHNTTARDSGSSPETVLADFIAHELGHMLFQLRDVTNEQRRGCVMQRDYITLDDSARLSLYDRRPPCGYETAMAALRRAREYAAAGERDKALGLFKDIALSLRDDIDGLRTVFHRMMLAGCYDEAASLATDLAANEPDPERRSTLEAWAEKISARQLSSFD